jgi:hypothetical protein
MRVRDWSDGLAAVFVLAIIAFLVRPNSVAPALIGAVGGALTALVSFATDNAAPSSASQTGGWITA